jgi:hypothetical protein
VQAVQLQITHPTHLIIPSKRERIMHGLSPRHIQQPGVLKSCVGLQGDHSVGTPSAHPHLDACSLRIFTSSTPEQVQGHLHERAPTPHIVWHQVTASRHSWVQRGARITATAPIPTRPPEKQLAVKHDNTAVHAEI